MQLKESELSRDFVEDAEYLQTNVDWKNCAGIAEKRKTDRNLRIPVGEKKLFITRI